MSTDAKKHTSFAAGETPTRAAIAAAILSIKDVIPVANTTERAQLITDLSSAGVTVSATQPVVVARADARGLHRIEYTLDGSVWLPASGVQTFADTTARDAWTSPNSALLSVGDRCEAGGVEYVWLGAEWDKAWKTITLTAAGAGGTIKYRHIGLTLVEIRSHVDITASIGNGNTTIATGVAADIRPVSGTVARGVVYFQTYSGVVGLTSSGDLIITNQTGSRTGASIDMLYSRG